MKQVSKSDPIKLLIVDDHLLVRKSIIGVLDRYETISIVGDFSGGAELLENIDKYEFDVILLDINMPGMNGIETMQRLNKLDPELKVIALTMHDDTETIREMMEAGARGYILKDSPFQELVKAIQQVKGGKTYFTNKVTNIMLEDYTNMIKKKNTDVDELISGREKEILALVAEGLTNKEIGDKLFLSSRTVENHRQNLKRKLKIESTAEMIKYAIANGIIVKTK